MPRESMIKHDSELVNPDGANATECVKSFAAATGMSKDDAHDYLVTSGYARAYVNHTYVTMTPEQRADAKVRKEQAKVADLNERAKVAQARALAAIKRAEEIAAVAKAAGAIAAAPKVRKVAK